MKALALVVVACAFSATASAAPKPSVAAAARAEIAAVQHADYATLWAAHSARYQAHCPHAAWLRNQRANAVDWSKPPWKGTKFRVARVYPAGAGAVVLSYEWVKGGKVLYRYDGDVWVFVGGRWLDEWDGQGCA